MLSAEGELGSWQLAVGSWQGEGVLSAECWVLRENSWQLAVGSWQGEGVMSDECWVLRENSWQLAVGSRLG